jgi:hypothetical protein
MFHHAPTPRLPAFMHVDRLASMHVSCLVVPASLLPPVMRRGNPVCRFQHLTGSPRHFPVCTRTTPRRAAYATSFTRCTPLAAAASCRSAIDDATCTPHGHESERVHARSRIHPFPNTQLHFVRSHARAHIHFPLLPLPLTSLHCRPAAKQHQSVHQ